MKKNDRIWELDALRGICILCVILIHLIFDLIYFIGLDLYLPAWYVFVQQYGGVIFVVLSGCCATLGSRSFRRGCIVFSCGMLISLVTFGMYRLGMASRDVIVWFGVLHLLASCMLLFGLTRGFWEALPAWVLPVLCLALIFLTAPCADGVTTQTPHLWLFGFTTPDFASADYFPLLPWFFVFLLGTWAGRYVKAGRLPQWFYTAKAPRLALVGRHALLLYVLHQPLLYALTMLLRLIFIR